MDIKALNKTLFLEYKQLMENTRIEECYSQVIYLLKTIQTTLEKDMDSFCFMNRVVENVMDFSYFQLTDDQLKKGGLKIQVVFFHKTCRFEIWGSGYNRAVQKNTIPFFPVY